MAFNLEVQFTGLCLHVRHRGPATRPEVAVLLPDGRFRGKGMRHFDNSPAAPHIGYLRMDLANLDPRPRGLPTGERESTGPGGESTTVTDGPHFELVYRFGNMIDLRGGGQTLDFGLPPADEPIEVETKLASLDDVAPGFPVRADLFTASAGARMPTNSNGRIVRSPLLLRTVLRGGTLAPSILEQGTDEWSIDPLPPNGVTDARQKGDTWARPPVAGQFPGGVTWKRRVRGRNDLTLTLTQFDGSNPTRIRLRPAVRDGERVIRLKIANLCAENPLEWNEFPLRSVILEDSDFKWFYTLLDPGKDPADPTKERGWSAILGNRALPAPRLVSQTAPQPHATSSGVQDCTGSEGSGDFPPFDDWGK